MEYTTINYKGKDYECRLIPDLEFEGCQLIVAPEVLGEQLKDEYGEFTDSGETVDLDIFFYASPDDMLLTDEQLFKLAV